MKLFRQLQTLVLTIAAIIGFIVYIITKDQMWANYTIITAVIAGWRDNHE